MGVWKNLKYSLWDYYQNKKLAKKQPLISIVCPTRCRVLSLERFIKSVYSKSSKNDNIELILISDQDDSYTNAFIRDFRYKFPNLNIKHICIVQKDNINRDYYALGAMMAEGTYIWGLGDDIEIRTTDYDQLINQQMGNFLVDKPDKLCYYWVRNDCRSDVESWWSHSSFPIFTRESVRLLKCMMPVEIPGWGADHAAKYIWTNLIDDRVCFSDIVMWHHSQHSGRSPQDETNKIMQSRSGGKGDLTKEEGDYYIGLLNGKIQSTKSS